jgi:hypothetical protein
MPGGLSSEADRLQPAGAVVREDCAPWEAGEKTRLQYLAERYREAAEARASSASAGPADLVEDERDERILAKWGLQLELLQHQAARVNAALGTAGVRLMIDPREPGPGVSYLACAEVRVEGELHELRARGFAAATQRAEVRLQIRTPGSPRHDTRYLGYGELGPDAWNEWLLDLLEANRPA